MTANEGQAPGMKRFFALTGIKESDWRGKYWVRWGDALAEAGLAPNEWTTANDEDDELARFAALARELRHFPVFAELGILRRSNPAIPSPKIFRRFGGKQELAARVRSFCLAACGGSREFHPELGSAESQFESPLMNEDARRTTYSRQRP